MIFLIHNRGKAVVEVLSDEAELKLQAVNCTAALWELASRYPEELIGWCDENYVSDLDLQQWKGIFHHDLIMASYSVEHAFLPESIGYVDQMPFVNVKRDVLYGTWRMSTDVGGIKGKVLLRFKDLMADIEDLGHLLNSVAKLGQQNSLFCYSAPGLVKRNPEKKILYTASTFQLFSFVYQHYNNIWTGLLFWCHMNYENRFPLAAFIKSFFRKKYFRTLVDLSDIVVRSGKKQESHASIDVIIPTIGRMKYLYDVINDLSRQTHLPQKVIIIEQNPDKNSVSDLLYLKHKEWPFEVVHHFLNRTGVCHARNVALQEITADWVFLADDDIRISSEFLAASLEELQRLGVDCLNFNCKQEGEKTVFPNIKQWGSFGSGTSMVRRTYASEIRFSEVLEFGYGEDKDFGMKLRNSGCEIIYHPDLEIQHLKAPVGGFRQKPILDWEKEDPLPKPSPTLMVYALRHYTPEQIKGFKTSLFLKFYTRQKILNPVTYLRLMKKRWEKSVDWAERLMAADSYTTYRETVKLSSQKDQC